MPKTGYISASMADRVMAKGRGKEPFGLTFDTLAREVASDRLGWNVRPDISGMAAVEWGIENEWLAIETYKETRLAEIHSAQEWQEHINWPGRFGCRPDGLIGKDGMIEVKCPNSNNHLDNILSNKQLDDYNPQMQFSLWVTNREWCDWVSFDPRAPEGLWLHVVRVDRDDTYIEELEYRANKCYELSTEYCERLKSMIGGGK